MALALVFSAAASALAEDYSAGMRFDGTPLTSEEASVEGLMAAGAPATETPPNFITATGQITDAGSAENSCAIHWNDDYKQQNYTVAAEDTGTLTVTPREIELYVEISAGGGGWVFGYEPEMRSEGLNWDDFSCVEKAAGVSLPFHGLSCAATADSPKNPLIP